MSLIMGRFNNRWEEEIPSRTRSGTIPARGRGGGILRGLDIYD